ncbi:MAG: ABC transporter permease [Anaerolineales bacterium]
MKKIWFAVRYEYSKTIRQKGFLLALFSLPLFIGLSVGLGMFMNSQENNSAAVGYVDNSGVLNDPIPISNISERDRVEFVQFSLESQANEALESNKIQAYFVLPKDYPKNKDIGLFFYEQPGENSIRDFYDYLQLNLVSGSQTEIRNRLALGSDITLRTPDGLREFPDNNPSVNMFLPLIFSFGFILLLLISSGYLMSGFLEEKSNRTIELLITSLSPSQLVGSKLLTMLAIGMTLMATWILVGVVAAFVGGNYLDIAWLQDLHLNWRDILPVVAAGLPSYTFAAALMLSIGLIIGDNQEAESIGPLFFIVAFIPLWLILPIAKDINGYLAIALSSIPIASLMTIGFRSMFIQIPLWQVLVSLTIQIIFVAGALWLAIRTFRIGMLRSGKRIRWNEIAARRKNIAREEV